MKGVTFSTGKSHVSLGWKWPTHSEVPTGKSFPFSPQLLNTLVPITVKVSLGADEAVRIILGEMSLEGRRVGVRRSRGETRCDRLSVSMRRRRQQRRRRRCGPGATESPRAAGEAPVGNTAERSGLSLNSNNSPNTVETRGTSSFSVHCLSCNFPLFLPHFALFLASSRALFPFPPMLFKSKAETRVFVIIYSRSSDLQFNSGCFWHFPKSCRNDSHERLVVCAQSASICREKLSETPLVVTTQVAALSHTLPLTVNRGTTINEINIQSPKCGSCSWRLSVHMTSLFIFNLLLKHTFFFSQCCMFRTLD